MQRNVIPGSLRIAVCALALSVVVPMTSHAQEDMEPMEAAEMEMLPDDGGAFMSDLPPGPGQIAGAAPDTYTIQSGDTLWDICAGMLGDPFFWPKLWTFNQYITNPHWIYPGNLLSFREGTETAPPQFEVTKPDAVAMQVEDPLEPVDPTVLEAMPIANDDLQDGFSIPTEEPAPQVAKVEDLALPPAEVAETFTGITLREEGFIAEAQVPPLGFVYKSDSEVTNLAENDHLYLKLSDPSMARVGKRLTVFRTLRRVKHPRTRKYLGFLTKIIADLEIIDVSGEVATARVRTSFDYINRGDPITESVEIVKRVELSRNSTTVEGMIVETMVEDLSIMGNGNVIYLDMGKSDGLRRGNTVDVVRRGDGLRRRDKADPALPEEIVGRLVVVGTRENTSTAVIVDSFDAVKIGDRVRMVSK